ncbi:MAG: lysine biosynthesis enzyme LysX, partial [Thermoproteota archaeon]|nr:lysine biosynthesis enzyme LysX [Thermoproteota archaeon]
MVEVSILCDKVRFEEKALYEKTQSMGIKSKIVDAKTLTIGTYSKAKDFLLGDVILQRSVSYYRGLYLAACLEFLGFKVINRFEVAQICGNKLSTSIRLAENKIPTPKTQFAFSAESGLETIKKTGFPVVLKPVVGSWGRGIYPLRDLETASMIIEMREEDDSPL